MIPTSSWNDFMRGAGEKARLKSMAGCLLFLNPSNSSVAQEQIVHNLKYLHLRSGHHLDFFLPGIASHEAGFLDNLSYYFDYTSFVSFLDELESVSSWRYHGGTQLVVFRYHQNEIDFSKVIDINLDRLIVLCQTPVIDVFFEMLIRSFREHSPERAVIDLRYPYLLTAAGWDVLIGFIQRDFGSIIRGMKNAVEIRKMFQPQDYRI